MRNIALASWVLVGCVDDGSGEDPPLPDAAADDSGVAADASVDPDAAPPDPDSARPDPDAAPDPDGCVRNACGECGPPPPEVCNERDDDCDGATDEGVGNACGRCGPVPEEACNMRDDDCDGVTDEGVRNACGVCGAPAAELCNGRDDDCDGTLDEDIDPDVNVELCDGVDNDCDGLTDEALRNACGDCGGVPEEVCNGQDDDCDGQTDEQVLNACGRCGEPPVEVCNERDDDCDGLVDEGGLLNACGDCGPAPAENCNERDDDCDGEIDEGLALNRCGEACGPEPAEVCNAFDDDCDGQTDEGLPVNACGVCGPAPVELCDGLDTDCDGEVDEGHLHNACGGCGPAPEEVCDGADQDCDGAVDEDFEVGRSVEHCLGCDAACPEINSVAECLGGRCIVLRCEDGFIDDDLNPENGCEGAVPDVPAVWVQEGVLEEGADGSEARPYPTIELGLANALENARVFVRAGDYAGADLNVRGVELIALDGARIVSEMLITADRARLRGFDLSPPVDGPVRTALTLSCTSGCSAVDNRITLVSHEVTGIRVTGGDNVQLGGNELVEVRATGVSNQRRAPRGLPATGIDVVGGRDLQIVGNVLRRIESSPPTPSSGFNLLGSGTAHGIKIDGVDGVLVSGNTVSGVRSADAVGRVATGPGVDAQEWQGTGYAGATAYAVWVNGSVRVTVVDNDIEDCRGGDGGDGTGTGGRHTARAGTPGSVFGIRLIAVSGARVAENRVSTLRGGTAGTLVVDVPEGRRTLGGRGGHGLGHRCARVSGHRAERQPLHPPRGRAGAPGRRRGARVGAGRRR